MLREILAVYKREVKSYLVSPAVYVVIGLFLGFVGLLYFNMLGEFVDMSQRKTTSQQMMYNAGPLNVTQVLVGGIFFMIHFVMLFAAPILTMRLFSEEKRLGTFELLVTCPLREWSILLGKFFAAVTVGLFILALCSVYPLTTQVASVWQAENPVILVSFLGLFLILSAYLSFGVFASALTENQMLSAILTFVGLMVFFLIGQLDLAGNATIQGVPLSDILRGISISTHFNNFTKGVISLTDLVYFILFPAFFLLLTAKILEARRWRV